MLYKCMYTENTYTYIDTSFKDFIRLCNIDNVVNLI